MINLNLTSSVTRNRSIDPILNQKFEKELEYQNLKKEFSNFIHALFHEFDEIFKIAQDNYRENGNDKNGLDFKKNCGCRMEINKKYDCPVAHCCKMHLQNLESFHATEIELNTYSNTSSKSSINSETLNNISDELQMSDKSATQDDYINSDSKEDQLANITLEDVYQYVSCDPLMNLTFAISGRKNLENISLDDICSGKIKFIDLSENDLKKLYEKDMKFKNSKTSK